MTLRAENSRTITDSFSYPRSHTFVQAQQCLTTNIIFTLMPMALFIQEARTAPHDLFLATGLVRAPLPLERSNRSHHELGAKKC